MMLLPKKPLRHSVDVWLATFVLCFLVWIWGDSFFHETRLSVLGHWRHISIYPGKLVAEWESGPGYATAPTSARLHFGRVKQQKPAGDFLFPDFYGWTDVMRYDTPPGTIFKGMESLPKVPGYAARIYHINVALWMPIVAFLLLWSIGKRMWRKRQSKRVFESSIG